MSAHLLEFPSDIWSDLINHLRKQSAGVRESGAFLLGRKSGNTKNVTGFLPYEQLQADSLHDDYVTLEGASFAKLWDICRRQGLSVVADVHTHRFGAQQSRSDRTNPMVALSGHVAFIVPRFAQGVIQLRELGMYVYQGNHQWSTYTNRDVERLVHFSGENK
jgi:proteasome lid subunit RPN8/RPN11